MCREALLDTRQDGVEDALGVFGTGGVKWDGVSVAESEVNDGVFRADSIWCGESRTVI